VVLYNMSVAGVRVVEFGSNCFDYHLVSRRCHLKTYGIHELDNHKLGLSLNNALSVDDTSY